MEQTERNESKGTNRRLIRMAALVPSVPEIRYLLARTPHFPTDTKALHHRLVAMATTTSGRSRDLTLQTACACATVVPTTCRDATGLNRIHPSARYIAKGRPTVVRCTLVSKDLNARAEAWLAEYDLRGVAT